MRTLSVKLTAEQKKLSYKGIWKIVLTKSGQTTRTYTNTRILDIDHEEEPYDQHAKVLLDNSDGALTSLALQGYQAVISYGMTTADGDEYSPTAPMKCLAMDFLSMEDKLVCTIECMGIPNLLAEDRASGSYIPTEHDLKTVKDLIAEIMAGTAASPFSGDSAWVQNTAYAVDNIVKRTDSNEYRYICTTAGTSHATTEPTWPDTIGEIVDDGTVTWQCVGSPVAIFSACPTYTVTWDSEDALIDVYLPTDSLRIYKNSSRLAVLRRLLDFTKCIARFEDDGEIHILQPTISGTTYDYQYALSAQHPFFSKANRKRLVIPNRIYVESQPNDGDSYTGNAIDTASYGALGYYINQYESARVTGNTQATSIAEAVLSKYQMHAQAGAARVPMNCGAEIYDYVLVTDARQSDTRTGNIGKITRKIHYDLRSQKITDYSMTFSFGAWLSVRQQVNLWELHPSGFGNAGQNFARLNVGDLYVQDIKAKNLDFAWADPNNTIDLSQIGDTLDGLPDGPVYSRVKSLHLDAGLIKMNEDILYKANYDPTDKFDLAGNTLDDLPYTEILYKRVLSSSLTAAGLVLLDQVEIEAGDDHYGLLLQTDISAGHILLSSQTVIKTGAGSEWYDEGYVSIDADIGITIGSGGSISDLIFDYGTYENYIYPVTGGLAYLAEDDHLFLTQGSGAVIVYMDIDPSSDSARSLGSNANRYLAGYFDNIYYTGGSLPDELDDLALIRGMKNKGNKLDYSTVPDFLKPNFDKNTKVKKKKDALILSEDKLREQVDEAIANETRPEKLAKLHKVKNKIGKNRQAKLQKYEQELDIETGQMSVGDSIHLSLGGIKKLAEKLDAIEARIAALEIA